MPSLFDRARSAVLTLAGRPDAQPFSGAMDEIGYARAALIGWYPDEEKNPDTLKIDDYINMLENDGQVQGVSRLLQYPVMSANWEIVEAEEGDSGEADFIRHIFTAPPHMGGMTTPMQHIIADMTRAFVEGFRLYEEVFYIIPVGPYKGRIGLKKLAPRDARTIWLRSDEHGGFDGARQRVFFKTAYNIVDLPKEKLVLYTYQKHKSWLYGQSALKAAYYHYDKKHKMYWAAHKAAEVSVIPPRLIKWLQPPNPSQQAAIETAIDQIGVNTRVGFPKNLLELEPYESRRGGELVNIKELIDEHNNQISKSILAQFIDLGSITGRSGSRSMSQDHSELFLKALQGEMRNMAEIFNMYVIPQLIDWNFGTDAYPRFEFKDISDEAGQLIKQAITGIFTDMKSLPSQFVNSTLTRMAEVLQIEYDPEAALAEITGQAEADVAAKNGTPAYKTASKDSPDPNSGDAVSEEQMSDVQKNLLKLAMSAYEKAKIKAADEIGADAPRSRQGDLAWIHDSVFELAEPTEESADALIKQAILRGKRLVLKLQPAA